MTDALALDLARDLIRCPSVTPEDAGAQSVLQKALKELGFQTARLRFGDDEEDGDGPAVDNLFARLGDAGPHLCFAGHTDVVPPGDATRWRHPPFAAEVEGSWLVGRGAADMKGNIAAFVGAVALFLGRHGMPKGSISLLITGDEEGPAVNGTVRVLDWMDAHGQIPDVCLVGESTCPQAVGEMIKIGRRGSLNGRIVVRGKQGHVAYPELAQNPIPVMVRLLDALHSTIFDQGSAYFPPTHLELTSVDVGNPVTNVIPEQATASFNVRFNDRWTHDSLARRIRDLLDATGCDYELDLWGNAQSFITRPGEWTHTVAGAVEDVTGRKPELSTTGGTSDARFITHYCPVVECGGVNATQHQVDERISLHELAQVRDIYLRVLERFFRV